MADLPPEPTFPEIPAPDIVAIMPQFLAVLAKIATKQGVL
jgi:hypothetical protein